MHIWEDSEDLTLFFYDKGVYVLCSATTEIIKILTDFLYARSHIFLVRVVLNSSNKNSSKLGWVA